MSLHQTGATFHLYTHLSSLSSYFICSHIFIFSHILSFIFDCNVTASKRCHISSLSSPFIVCSTLTFIFIFYLFLTSYLLSLTAMSLHQTGATFHLYPHLLSLYFFLSFCSISSSVAYLYPDLLSISSRFIFILTLFPRT